MKIEHIIQMERRDDSIKSQAILYKGELYTYFDSGLTRHVFTNDSKTKVIKILIDSNHKDYNREEYEIYQNADDATKEQLAKTELAFNGGILEQEFCNPIKFDDREMTIPQMLFASSCRNECGWTADGKLICFDLSEFKKY